MKEIFKYHNGVAYTECGGRYIIMLPSGVFVDFGSGKKKGVVREIRTKQSWFHDLLGNITAEESRFILHDHNSEVDFDELKNSRFIDNRHIKHPAHGIASVDWNYTLYHLYNFLKKHHNRQEIMNN